jgi:hypothetical protein
VGTVALLRAGDIGRKVWLQPPAGEQVGPFLVIDCAHPEDIPRLRDLNWAVDVSYEVGQLWGMDRPLDQVMVLADPADEGAPAPLLLPPTPFSVPSDQVVVTRPTPTLAITVPVVRPTPWPTRRPEPRPGVPTLEASAEPPTPAAPPPPTPLTPIVTTPTPRSQATVVVPAPPPVVQPAPQSVEVAVGRPGASLLQGELFLPASARTSRPSPGPTIRAAITPLVTSAPILPAGVTPPPAPTPPRNELPLLRFWRALLSLIGR